jgi:hypothetical protein
MCTGMAGGGESAVGDEGLGSYGIVLAEMTAREWAYPGLDPEDILQQVRDHHLRPALPGLFCCCSLCCSFLTTQQPGPQNN